MAEYFRDFEVETIGLKETPCSCSSDDCGARLKDTVVDWEDALPPKELNPAEKHCKVADAVLCLGTSLQITPACNLPLKSLRGGGKFVIVSLQVDSLKEKLLEKLEQFIVDLELDSREVKSLQKPLIYRRYKEAAVCNHRKYLLSRPFPPPPISHHYSVAKSLLRRYVDLLRRLRASQKVRFLVVLIFVPFCLYVLILSNLPRSGSYRYSKNQESNCKLRLDC